MAKAVVKSRPAEKEAVMAMSKKSKSLEKKSKKKLAIRSPEAKKVSLALKKEKKNKPKAEEVAAAPAEQSPKKEIKLKSKVLTKGENSETKASRFAEMQKIHKVIKKKGLKKAKSEPEDRDSDASEDEEDDAACKSYAQDFGLDEMDAAGDSDAADNSDAADDSEAAEDSDAAMDDDEEETSDKKDGKPTKDGKKAKSLKKQKKKRSENFVDHNDPAEQAKTVMITNVNLKTTRKHIASRMRQYGKVISVRLRNLPVLKKSKAKSAVNIQAKLRQFKKEATSCSAYVKFENPEQATAALAENATLMDGHHIFVKSVVTMSGEEKRRALAAGNQILVGNLPFSMEAEPLFNQFNPYGKIVSISIPKTKYGNSKGVAFIEFQDKSSVPGALKKNGVKIQGREMRVSKAVRKVKKSDSTGAKKSIGKKNIKSRLGPKNKSNVDNENKSNVETKNKSNAENKNKSNVENKNKSNAENKNKSNVENKNKSNVENKNKSNVENKSIKRQIIKTNKKSPTPKKQAVKRRVNKEELKKLTIARKLAAKQGSAKQ